MQPTTTIESATYIAPRPVATPLRKRDDIAGHEAFLMLIRPGRGLKVAILAGIYRLASHVVAWLGPAEN
jgi:hypothetical protein